VSHPEIRIGIAPGLPPQDRAQVILDGHAKHGLSNRISIRYRGNAARGESGRIDGRLGIVFGRERGASWREPPEQAFARRPRRTGQIGMGER